MKKDVVFLWSPKFQHSFDTVKAKMASASILVFLDWNKEFHVHVDASFDVLGVVLAYRSDDDLDNPDFFCELKVIIRREELYKHGA